ncbi:unnamed protein product [Absidia cylindrospora]
MKPCLDGSALSFERLGKASVTTTTDDQLSEIEIIRFFWQVKGMLERAMESVNKLRISNNMNYLAQMDTIDQVTPQLPSALKPTPVKPVKGPNSNKIASLDPVSIL